MRAVLLLAWLLRAAPAQPAARDPQAVTMPQQPQIINLSLLAALVAIDAQDLAGVFGYIPEASAPAALADYLLHDRRALKRFVKKGEADLKQAEGVNEWDQKTFLYMLAILSSGGPPPGVETLTGGLLDRVRALGSAPALPLSEITARRKK